MKNGKGVYFGGLVLILCIHGCAAPVNSSGQNVAYDMNSWREIIPESCTSFSDGCNTCNRTAGAGEAACTRRACAVYTRPVCLDENPVNNSGTALGTGRQVEYLCPGGNVYSVYFGEYTADDQRVRLSEDQIMLRDHQTHTVHMLSRERSGSGTLYKSGDLEFFGKGEEAMISRNGTSLDSECRVN